MLNRRIEHCGVISPSKEGLCGKLKRAVEQKEVERVINAQMDKKALPISYYLKIMQLVLAIGIESE